MAIQKAILISFDVLGDGTTTTFNLDLLADPYAAPADIRNWFSGNPLDSQPIAALVSNPGSATLSLSGTTVTVTFATAPSGSSVTAVQFYLLF